MALRALVTGAPINESSVIRHGHEIHVASIDVVRLIDLSFAGAAAVKVEH